MLDSGFIRFKPDASPSWDDCDVRFLKKRWQLDEVVQFFYQMQDMRLISDPFLYRISIKTGRRIDKSTFATRQKHMDEFSSCEENVPEIFKKRNKVMIYRQNDTSSGFAQNKLSSSSSFVAHVRQFNKSHRN